MKKILVYTFRTFPFMNELENTFQKVYIFGKIKEDLNFFLNEIKKLNPDFILGIAKSNDSNSYFETIAVNQFNAKSKIIKNTNKKLDLFIPNLINTNFKISKNPSISFCNYTMYKIKYFLEEEKLKIPFSFVHINQKHIQEIIFVSNINKNAAKNQFKKR